MELKNDVELTGKLHSVDQYLNIKLEDVQVVKKERYPQLVRKWLWVGCCGRTIGTRNRPSARSTD